MHTPESSPVLKPPIILTTNRNDPRFDEPEVADFWRRQEIADGVSKFVEKKDPETVKQVVGNIQNGVAQEVMEDSVFDRFMRGIRLHIDEEKSKWANEIGGGASGLLEMKMDFEAELETLKGKTDAGVYSHKSWSEFGNGGKHMAHMSNEAVQMFINKYDFHPCDDVEEFARIAKRDPWVKAFVTNETAL